MNGKYQIDEQTFKNMDTNSQLWMLFETFNDQRILCEDRFCKFDDRFYKLENRKAFDTTMSSGSGLIGGIIAVLLSKLWWFK